MIHSKTILYILFYLYIFLHPSFTQNLKENWVPVKSENNNKIYINASNLTDTQSGDIYAWVLEEFKEPLLLEGIDGNIYQSKTYYLINKDKMRYSILQIIFFDEDKNVLKSYNYEHTSDLQYFKYNSPLLKGSDAEAVLQKCLNLSKPNSD